MKTETPLIDLAPKLFTTVTKAQEALAKWIIPNSGISDAEVLNQLLGILDDSGLVKQMREVEPVWMEGDKFTTPETGDSIFTVNKVSKYDVEARDGRSRSGTTSFAKHYITKV